MFRSKIGARGRIESLYISVIDIQSTPPHMMGWGTKAHFWVRAGPQSAVCTFLGQRRRREPRIATYIVDLPLPPQVHTKKTYFSTCSECRRDHSEYHRPLRKRKAMSGAPNAEVEALRAQVAELQVCMIASPLSTPKYSPCRIISAENSPTMSHFVAAPRGHRLPPPPRATPPALFSTL